MDSTHFQTRAAAALLQLMAESRLVVPTASDLASRMNITTATLLEHCPEMDALLLSMVQDVVTRLSDTCVKRLVQADPDQPLEQVRALAQGFLQWGLDHPAEVLLLTDQRVQKFGGDPENMRMLSAIFSLLHKFLARAQDMGHIRADLDVSASVLPAVSFAYGLLRLVDCVPLARFAESYAEIEGSDINALLQRALDDYIDNLRPV